MLAIRNRELFEIDCIKYIGFDNIYSFDLECIIADKGFFSCLGCMLNRKCFIYTINSIIDYDEYQRLRVV